MYIYFYYFIVLILMNSFVNRNFTLQSNPATLSSYISRSKTLPDHQRVLPRDRVTPAAHPLIPISPLTTTALL